MQTGWLSPQVALDIFEVWKSVPIPGFEHYEVSSLGNVRNGLPQSSKSHKRGKNLALYADVNGYVYVNLSSGKNGKLKPGVHRLVAMAFIPNPENKDIVNHKDGKKWNNTQSNLEWLTAAENMQHAVETGLAHNKSKIEENGWTEAFFTDYKACIDWLSAKYGVEQNEVRRFIKKRQHSYMK